MKSVRPPGILDQTTTLLRDGVRNGRWSGHLPGVHVLAKHLQVSPGTVQTALKRLEKEKVLKRGGVGRRREIPSAATGTARTGLLVGLMVDEQFQSEISNASHTMEKIQMALEKKGHRPFFAADTMKSLGHKPRVILAKMRDTAADLWIVWNAERSILEALVKKATKPVLAVAGSSEGLSLASCAIDTNAAVESAVRSVTRKGHSRIVLAMPDYYRNAYSRTREVFLTTLREEGISPGAYHTPYYEAHRDGFEKMLKSLFKLTPPTVMIVIDARQIVAIHAFLSARGMSSKGLSLIVMHPEWPLDWMKPRPGYFHTPYEEYVRHAVRWTEAHARGVPDREPVMIEARYVPGE